MSNCSPIDTLELVFMEGTRPRELHIMVFADIDKFTSFVKRVNPREGNRIEGLHNLLGCCHPYNVTHYYNRDKKYPVGIVNFAVPSEGGFYKDDITFDEYTQTLVMAAAYELMEGCLQDIGDTVKDIPRRSAILTNLWWKLHVRIKPLYNKKREELKMSSKFSNISSGKPFWVESPVNKGVPNNFVIYKEIGALGKLYDMSSYPEYISEPVSSDSDYIYDRYLTPLTQVIKYRLDKDEYLYAVEFDLERIASIHPHPQLKVIFVEHVQRMISSVAFKLATLSLNLDGTFTDDIGNYYETIHSNLEKFLIVELNRLRD